MISLFSRDYWSILINQLEIQLNEILIIYMLQVENEFSDKEQDLFEIQLNQH